jgi:alpha-tubulin N-acetyltransferase 1
MNRFAGSEHRLYMKVQGNTVQGFIKVGVKDLFYRDTSGRCKEISPLCVLDFYVHESVQRQGLGKSLFMKMLSSENVLPAKLAYDRPSPKLIKFLQKHFGLSHFIPQNNNFVIFDDYFRVERTNQGEPTPAAAGQRERPPRGLPVGQERLAVRAAQRRAVQTRAWPKRGANRPAAVRRPQQETHEQYSTFEIRAGRRVQ